jgi:choline monooxygenase
VIDDRVRAELARFDPVLPIESAWTPPASWYQDPRFLDAERAAIFRDSWQAVGRVDQVQHPGDYFTGCLLDLPFVVLRDGTGLLRAFHNVCRHHAAEVCAGSGHLDELSCPYHGWTYRLDGRLTRAPQLGRNDVFDRERFSLKPAAVEAWGPLVFVHLGENPPPLQPQLAELKRRLDAMGTGDLSFVARRSYDLRCNWKVYVDNYLDGGYHVAVLHQALAGQLDLDTYVTEILDRVSIQSVRSPAEAPDAGGGDFAERIGSEALYAFVHPNFMLNRYGRAALARYDSRRLRFLLPRDGRRRCRRVHRTQHRREPPRPGRRRPDLRVGAARSRLPRLRPRHLRAQDRAGRLSVPQAAQRRPEARVFLAMPERNLGQLTRV